jgi:hypothetical protein
MSALSLRSETNSGSRSMIAGEQRIIEIPREFACRVGVAAIELAVDYDFRAGSGADGETDDRMGSLWV